ncbi:PPC domain-containing protein [Gloeothece verrucosa]|uniref:Peptidase domain protein n=1 Tax=Gloeothece verrucosa (strain PCC 7822) TaxID=497965 RepID=E0UBH3_GLOV7|nr:PPC domain-containing protein [Gloeothece verrucosa]ADN12805.1 peptidase domain protein [Gloeothece verrucosa PCC 7822]
MKSSLAKPWHSVVFLATILLTIWYEPLPVKAEKLYTPLPLPSNNEVNDNLTDEDIPTGEGGFARDYYVQLREGDQVAIDLISEDFDAIVILMAADGSTIAENDDGPDGSTNALLFARISETGKYIIRVRAFGETGSGRFTLKVTRLRPAN